MVLKRCSHAYEKLLSMRMEKKEKVQEFNQRFNTLLNSFSVVTKSTEESLVEYYTTSLYPPISMFVKRAVKPTLAENYEEEKRVEAYLDSITRHTSEPEVKTTSSKKTLLLTRTKKEHSNELENVVKMVQK